MCLLYKLVLWLTCVLFRHIHERGERAAKDQINTQKIKKKKKVAFENEQRGQICKQAAYGCVYCLDEARVRKCGHCASLKRQGGTFPESARSTIHNNLLKEANFGY